MESNNDYYFHCDPYHFGKMKGSAQTGNQSKPEDNKEADQVIDYLKRRVD